MTEPFSPDDLATARTWLQRASNALSGGEDSSPESVAYAHAAAVIGNGFVGLGHATRALQAMDESAKVTARQLVAFDAIAEAAADAEAPTLDAAIERKRQAHAEARPHDDELSTALRAGRTVEVHIGAHVCVGQVKHLGNETGPLVVVIPEEVTP